MRFLWLARYTPILLIEISHFVSSIIGLVLVLVGFGLSRKLDAAWAASVILLPIAAVLALTKGVRLGGIGHLDGGVLGALLPFHDAFPRAARLTRMEITPGWMVSALAAVAGAAIARLVVVPERRLWREELSGAMVDPAPTPPARCARRPAAAVLLLASASGGCWPRRRRPKVVGEDDPDFSRVRAILAGPKAPSRTPTWRCWATSASCSRPRGARS